MPKFRTAYVCEPGFDFSPLLEVAENIVYITNGFEKGVNQIAHSVHVALVAFDDDKDIFVPVGKVLTVMLATDYLDGANPFNVAVYDQRKYEIIDISSLVEGES